MAGWYAGDVDRERELARAIAQGWVDGKGRADAPTGEEAQDQASEALREEASAASAQPGEKAKLAEVEVEQDMSAQARFLRHRQRAVSRGIAKGAAATDASLLAAAAPARQEDGPAASGGPRATRAPSRRWQPYGGYQPRGEDCDS